ncbi:MAG: peptidoglycan-binding protein [Candidatus Pacebacteria bacterium]|nr:peptidoglycan-binding protein [Candidatus Paceibacterota bacterium]
MVTGVSLVPEKKILSDFAVPTLSLSPLTTGTTLTGIASETLGSIFSVEYQIDTTSNAWTLCTPDDGTFDGVSESFTCTLGTPSRGAHTVYVRATDDSTNTTAEEDYASATFSTALPGGGALLNNTTHASTKTRDSTTASSTEVATTTSITTATTPVTFATTTEVTETPVSDNHTFFNLVDLLVALRIIPAEKVNLARKAVQESIGENVRPTISLPTTFRFTRYLKEGDTHPEVKQLQQFLNTHGFTVSPTGPGSAGNETDYFGPATRNALSRFQEAHKADILTPLGLTAPTGVFHVTSLKKANELLSS